MWPLLLTIVATGCAFRATAGAPPGTWTYRMPCAVLGLWVGAVLMVPVSAVAALLILAADRHTPETTQLWSTVPTVGVSAALLVLSGRIAVRFRRLNRAARQRRRRHEMLIDLFAVRHPELPGVDVVPDARLFAYSVPCVVSGRIVLSQGTLDQLDPEPLRAVLAHERAHLVARHHLVLQLATALAQMFPRLGTGGTATGRIPTLIEMAADCRARRRIGRQHTIDALTVLAGTPVPDGMLAAGHHAVALRLAVLRRPADCCQAGRAAGVYAAAVAMLALAPTVALLNQIVDLCLPGVA
ncbi:M56 family metallopeptidase [Micromonospora cathayae]|uniref:M56 family metallopeptidase n=1 Tax=Micromonospora cathayae TaxID=3028804 RepID=A0ABY7ZIM1_9ACTN|nr:M56 family metallopeptidase [Micromonospora sp. HUAS 3]WDZ82834.1 M56 family metallopeptidase [Micromonospora sp. HUAS 3]